MTRRAAISLGIGAIAAAQDGVETLHAEMWRRFIDRRFHTLYDYAGLKGEVILPTSEDCRLCRPNALAWWTPIENGAFFGGLYLDALVRRWARVRTPAAASDARRIAAGLVRLASVGSVAGFVSRGVIADGKGHYVAGSDDQTFPWFLGLWRYTKSGIPSRDESSRITKLLLRTAVAIEKLDWRMPCDSGFGVRGEWTGLNFIHAARLLFVLRAMHDLSGDGRWLSLYRKLAEGRLQHCAQGASYEPPGSKDRYPINPPFWTSASSQAGMRVLFEMEDSEEFRSAYRTGLNANASSAAQHVGLSRSFDNKDESTFTTDWRFLNDYWEAQPTIQDAVRLGSSQVREWHRRSPRRVYEARFMREPLFAAWIVSMAADREITRQHQSSILAAMSHYDCKRLFTSLFFVATNTFEELANLRGV